jgi:Tol biopolymer transport system component
MNLDGSGNKRIMADGGYPTWSPDAAKIAFLGGFGAGGNAIYSMNADGTGKTAVNTATGWFSLSWTHGPENIILGHKQPAPYEQMQLYSVPADGPASTPPTQLTFSTGPNDNPDMSAFNSAITYNTDQPCLLSNDVCIPLTNGLWGIKPRWSPEGKRVVFTSGGLDAPGEENIAVVNVDNRVVTKLTTLNRVGQQELNPVWTSDGKRIVFTSNRDYSGPCCGPWAIYSVDAQTPNQTPTRLTNNAFDDIRLDCSWCPRFDH